MKAQAYLDMMKRQQQELTDFPIAYAFNEKQLEEALAKLGATKEECCTYLNMGDVMKKTDVPAFKAMLKRHTEELLMCDEPDRYPDVTRLVHRAGDLEKVDFNKVLAEAKSKGYKYSKNSIHNNDYLMKYNDGYFRIGLVDITYGVIDEGEKIDVYFNGKNRPITIENDLGIGIVLPIRTDGELEGSIIIEVKGE